MLSSILLPDLSFQSKFETALNYSWTVSLQQGNKALVILYKILLPEKEITFLVSGYTNGMFYIHVFKHISTISCTVFFSDFCCPLLVRFTVYAYMFKYRFGLFENSHTCTQCYCSYLSVFQIHLAKYSKGSWPNYPISEKQSDYFSWTFKDSSFGLMTYCHRLKIRGLLNFLQIGILTSYK